MKKIILATQILCISICKLYAQDFQGDSHIDIKLDRPFSETFRVKKAEMSSGNLEINEALFSTKGNMETADTKKGFGLDNKFSNLGGSGLFTIFQASPFKGMVGKFFFEENVNGYWHDAAILYVDMPLIGSKEIHLDYLPGFGARAFSNNPINRGAYTNVVDIAKGNGYLLSDILGKGDWKSRGTVFELRVSIVARQWLNVAMDLPTNGSTTINGIINIDKNTIEPNDGISFENAVKKTLKLNLISPTKAVWIKQDNDDSYVQLQNETGVGTVEFYDFDNSNFTAKYRIRNAPNLVYNQKYFDSQIDVANALYCASDKSTCFELYSENIGKFLYNDIANKTSVKTAIYSAIIFEIFGDAEHYWKPADGNLQPSKGSLIVDPNNIFNASPQLKITAAANQNNAILSSLKNTTYDKQGNINIEATAINIQGLWSISNQKNGLIIDPNYRAWQSKINAVINPSDIKTQVNINAQEIQSSSQKNNTLIRSTNTIDTKLNINKANDKEKILIKSTSKTIKN